MVLLADCARVLIAANCSNVLESRGSDLATRVANEISSYSLYRARSFCRF